MMMLVVDSIWDDQISQNTPDFPESILAWPNVDRNISIQKKPCIMSPHTRNRLQAISSFFFRTYRALLKHKQNLILISTTIVGAIRASVDALCRDGAGLISRERVQRGRLTRQGTTS